MAKGFRSSPSHAFQRAMGRPPQRVHPFTHPISKPHGPLDAAALYHYWNPDRDGVEQAPAEVKARLLAISGVDDQGRPKLAAVRPPAGAPIRCRCWLVFYRKPEVTHWFSPGWLLILAWHDGGEPHPTPLPIDNRLYANLTLQSITGGRAIFGRDFDNAREYFEHIVSVMMADKRKQETANQQYLDDRRLDFWGYTKIKNIGHGSKFALHHDGTVMPGRGEQNWLRERQLPLPADVERRVLAETRKTAGVAVAALNDAQMKQRQLASDRELAELRMRQQIRDLAKLRRRETVSLTVPRSTTQREQER